jgi:DNA-binding beta-propeller fold protein YncE
MRRNPSPFALATVSLLCILILAACNCGSTTVGPAHPVSLEVTPATQTVAVGNALAFTAVELYSDGTKHPPAGAVTWTSGTPATATIVSIAPSSTAANAIAAALAAGTTTITATEGTLTPGTADLTVVKGTAHYAYVSNINDGNIQWYSVTATAKPYLTSNGTTPPKGFDPEQAFLHPSGKFMYVIDVLSDVWVYDIAPSSSTTPAPGTPIFTNQIEQIAGDASPDYGVVDPYGRFLYVANSSDSTIYGYQISRTDGSLTAIQGSPFSDNLNGPQCIIIDHSGGYLYAINAGTGAGSNMVSAYTIDPLSSATPGALHVLTAEPTIDTGNFPAFAALDPSGTHIYVANGDNTVSGYTIGSGGVLSLLSTTTITNAVSVLNVAVDPSGKYLYVLDGGNPTTTPPTNGQLYGYTLSNAGVPSTTPITTTPIATGEAPTGIAIDPTGVLIAVDNGGDTQNPSTISLFSIGNGGVLTTDTPVATGVNPIFVIFYNAP